MDDVTAKQLERAVVVAVAAQGGTAVLTPDEARELAAELVRAADLAERYTDPPRHAFRRIAFAGRATK